MDEPSHDSDATQASPSQPRATIVPAVVVAVLILPLAVAVGVSSFLVALMPLERAFDSAEVMYTLLRIALTPQGMILLIVPMQATYAGVAYLVVQRTETDRRAALGLRRPRLPWWTTPVFMFATPLVGLVAFLMRGDAPVDPTQTMQFLSGIVQQSSFGAFVLLLLLMTLLPAFCEELLFRGYLQRRLATRVPTAAAVVLCSVLFAATHLDVWQMLAVLPLGLFLGAITARADSIWPAVCCHGFNNFLVGVLTRWGAHAGRRPNLADAVAMILLVLCVAAIIASIIVLAHVQPRDRCKDEATDHSTA